MINKPTYNSELLMATKKTLIQLRWCSCFSTYFFVTDGRPKYAHASAHGKFDDKDGSYLSGAHYGVIRYGQALGIT
jgi:hypothetical protein